MLDITMAEILKSESQVDLTPILLGGRKVAMEFGAFL